MSEERAKQAAEDEARTGTFAAMAAADRTGLAAETRATRPDTLLLDLASIFSNIEIFLLIISMFCIKIETGGRWF